jgi:hypothetical protein
MITGVICLGQSVVEKRRIVSAVVMYGGESTVAVFPRGWKSRISMRGDVVDDSGLNSSESMGTRGYARSKEAPVSLLGMPTNRYRVS